MKSHDEHASIGATSSQREPDRFGLGRFAEPLM